MSFLPPSVFLLLADIAPQYGNSLDRFSATMIRLVFLIVVPTLLLIGAIMLARNAFERRQLRLQTRALRNARDRLAARLGATQSGGILHFVYDQLAFRLHLSDTDSYDESLPAKTLGTGWIGCVADDLPLGLCWNTPISLLKSHTDWTQLVDDPPPHIEGARSWVVATRASDNATELRVDFAALNANLEDTLAQMVRAATTIQSVSRARLSRVAGGGH